MQVLSKEHFPAERIRNPKQNKKKMSGKMMGSLGDRDTINWRQGVNRTLRKRQKGKARNTSRR